jgi:hypothetical protein
MNEATIRDQLEKKDFLCPECKREKVFYFKDCVHEDFVLEISREL